MPDSKSDLLPAMAIRRFDVFAEFTRQDRLKKGEPEDVAKGYGIWLAKVVASRKFGTKAKEGGAHKQYPEDEKFRSLDDIEQTDKVFDHDIVDRMGEEFYRTVFVPAIKEAHDDGKKYEEIRDSIRKEWKPAKAKR